MNPARLKDKVLGKALVPGTQKPAQIGRSFSGGSAGRPAPSRGRGGSGNPARGFPLKACPSQDPIMAPRSYWKGYLKLSLVTCPVTMTPATSEGGRLRFRMLNAKTGNPVEMRYVDSVTGKPVRDEDEVRGYPVGEEKHVILEEEELESVALESTRTIDIAQFVPADSIGWGYYDKPHYLLPADRVGEEAFAVIREAMAASDTVGIARLVLYRRERAVMLKPRGRGILLWTLRYGDELRPASDYFDGIPAGRPSPASLKLMTRLIDQHSRDWSADMSQDPMRDKLQEMIAAKTRKGKRAAKPKAPQSKGGDNVISMLDALKASLAQEKGRKG